MCRFSLSTALQKLPYPLLSLGCALLMLTSCGGGSSENEAAAPTRLFPNEVMTGTISIGDANKLTITPTYENRDYTQGFKGYAGSIQSGNGIQQADFNGKNMRQVDSGAPGRLVFYFDADSSAPLEGILILELSATDTDDAARVRSGAVASGTILEYRADSGTPTTTLDLTGSQVTVTW